MAINFPGPYEVRIFYDVNIGSLVLTHQQRLNVRVSGTPSPGDAFDAVNVLRRDGSLFALDNEVDEWITKIKAVFHTTVTFTYAELWRYVPDSFESSFVSTYDINVVGTSATAPQAAGQVIWSFRTEEGGTMKISLMETSIAAGTSRTYAFMTVQEKAIADAVRLGTSPWLGRDTSYPFAVTKLYPGQNEALFKKRYRQS